MICRRSALYALVCIALGLLAAGLAGAQVEYPTTYPSIDWENSDPAYVSLENDYIQCNVGQSGTMKVYAQCDDADDGDDSIFHGDKVPDDDTHSWGVSGRYGIVAMSGDPDIADDDNRSLTYMGMYPCHYFGYWKLKIGNDMRMVGDGGSGSWYSENQFSQIMIPTLYLSPPSDISDKGSLGRTGPYVRGIWRTTGGNGSTILTEIRIHLVRDLVRFEYRITNAGSKSEYVGFCQNGDVEVGDPVYITKDNGYYGPYDNQNFAYIAGKGAAYPFTKQSAMIYRGQSVPDSFEVYDDVQNPTNVTRNILSLGDATKPDYAAIGEYNDLFHKDMWPPTGYKPVSDHVISDMCWVLCWDQKTLAPGATRTIVTYYGMGASTSEWTYLSSKTATRDSAVLSVQAPRSLKYDSTAVVSNEPELSPSTFTVKAWVYNLATDPGLYDLRDVDATIYLPKGLELVEGVDDNDATKEMGEIDLNNESSPVEWTVAATGECAGRLPIYVSVVDHETNWQQTVVRYITVPATKRGQFTYGWQLMSVPFSFNDFTLSHVFGLTSGTFSAKYWNGSSNLTMTQVKTGQGFWMYVLNGPTWQNPQTFYLVDDTAIVGADSAQTKTFSITLKKGWNMIGNPFVYPIYWRQILVGNVTTNVAIPMADAISNNWLDSTLFGWNTDKWSYDILKNTDVMLDPWKGYWIYARRAVKLIMQPPLIPNGNVTAYSGGL